MKIFHVFLRNSSLIIGENLILNDFWIPFEKKLCIFFPTAQFH